MKFIRATCVGLLAVATFAPAIASFAAPPNLVVILMDDMGYGDIAPFGSKLNRTPNLDRLAAEGMKLTSFYCAPVCSASRAQLMTGCYAKRVGISGALPPVASRGLNPNEVTVAELLRARGYATMIIGKWHLGDQPEFLPTRQGFDHYLGLPYSNDMGGDGKLKKQPKNGKVENRPPLPLLRDEQVIEAPAEQDTLTARYTEAAVNFIFAHTNRPFFLYLAHTAVHVPLHPGQAFRGKSANGLYGDWVEESDWSVGRVMEALRRSHLDTNTLVLFTSDNGPWLSKGTNAGSAGPLRGGKFSTWEGGLREPAIAWWPGKIAAGTTSDALLSQMDVLPTVARLAGGEAPTDRVIDGRDIWPVLSGQTKESPHESLFYFGGNTLEAVRSGPWKLAIAPQGKSKKDDDPDKVPATLDTPRLYHLDTDIGETTDVAAAHPEVVKGLKALLERMDKDLGLRGDKAPGIRPPGYVANPQPLLKRGSDEYD